MLKRIAEKWNRYQVRARAIRELSALSDKELKDLGISRCDIRQIV